MGFDGLVPKEKRGAFGEAEKDTGGRGEGVGGEVSVGEAGEKEGVVGEVGLDDDGMEMEKIERRRGVEIEEGEESLEGLVEGF